MHMSHHYSPFYSFSSLSPSSSNFFHDVNFQGWIGACSIIGKYFNTALRFFKQGEVSISRKNQFEEKNSLLSLRILMKLSVSSQEALIPTPQKVLKALRQALSFLNKSTLFFQNLFNFLEIESKQLANFLFKMLDSCLVSSFFPLLDFVKELQVSPEIKIFLYGISSKRSAKFSGNLKTLDFSACKGQSIFAQILTSTS